MRDFFQQFFHDILNPGIEGCFGMFNEEQEYIYRTYNEAEYGDMLSQKELGDICFFGKYNITINKKEAAKWYIKSANKGEKDSQMMIGTMLIEANGIPQDVSEGISWLKKSAKQGHKQSSHNLGYIYYKGEIVHKDFELAIFHLEQSAEKDFESSQRLLGVIYYREIVNKEKSAYWLKRAARGGSHYAKELLTDYDLWMF